MPWGAGRRDVPCARRVLASVSWFPASCPGGGSSCGGGRSSISLWMWMPSLLTQASETRGEGEGEQGWQWWLVALHPLSFCWKSPILPARRTVQGHLGGAGL